MKKKTIFSVVGALGLAAFVLYSFTTDVKSLAALSAKASAGACVPDPNSVCISRDNGQVYVGYKEVVIESEEQVN